MLWVGVFHESVMRALVLGLGCVAYPANAYRIDAPPGRC
jgi:hypothetical protein